MGAESRNCVTIKDCRVLAVSTKNHSVKVEHEGWDEPHWFPDSQISDDSEIYSGSSRNDEGKLIITEWIAKKEGVYDE